MQTWYYSNSGEQKGPVSLDELRALLSDNQLNPVSDLAWTSGMTNWQPVGQIPALSGSAAPAASELAPDSFNPYAAPQTSPDDLRAPVQSGSLAEIPPGSAPLEVMGCIKRGFELTKRHFGSILVIGVVYLVISMAVGFVEGLISGVMGSTASNEGEPVFQPLLIPIKLVSSVVSIILGAGLTRAALNISSGHEATIGTLFGEAGKLLPLIVASLLFYIMLIVGLLLLVLPGIYVALRFGFFMTAIVDRNLGPVEALKYSYRITTNNALSLFGLWIMLALIALAGVLALLVGLVVAIPVVTLAIALAYRYLQFGPGALQDEPGATIPLLKGATR